MSIRNLKFIDSTTIRSFSEILRVVGREPLDGSRRNWGIKMHTMMDAFSRVTEFVPCPGAVYTMVSSWDKLQGLAKGVG